MRKTIDGTTCDTDSSTATVVSTYESTPAPGHRTRRVYERLFYDTETGEFFLHGRGEPLSDRWESLANGYRPSGETLLLLSDEEALNWCQERNVDEETILGYFQHLGE